MSTQVSPNNANLIGVKDNFKSQVDNDSLLFIFANNEKPICYSRELLFSQIEISPGVTKTYKELHVDKLIFHNGALNVLYKNKNGNWVRFQDLANRYPNQLDIFAFASQELQEQVFTYQRHLIPEVNFVDSKRFVHYIEEGDGANNYYIKPSKYMDTRVGFGIKVEPFSIDDKTLTFEKRHLMKDLKITILNDDFKGSISDYLISVNGIFSEPIVDDTNNKIFYISEGMNIVGTVSYNTDAAGRDVHYYNVEIDIFGWEDVKFSSYSNVINIGQKEINIRDVSYVVVNELYFDSEINDDAHMLFCNGRLMDKSEYKIDSFNKKHISLTKIVDDTRDELFNILPYYTDEHTGVNHFNTNWWFKNMAHNKVYTFVNLEDVNKSKTLKVLRTRPLMTSFPNDNSILFRKHYLYDLVVVSGYYLRFLIKQFGYYEYPRTQTTYDDGELNLVNSSDIYRIQIVES